MGKYGRLGNQLHQIAFLIGVCELYNCEFAIPAWKYSICFPNHPEEKILDADLELIEPQYYYTPDFWEKYKSEFQKCIVNVSGYFQTEKYWQHCREKVLKAFEFHPEILMKAEIIKGSFRFQKSIAICVRRGDYVSSPDFYLQPLGYFFSALESYFGDYTKHNIIIFSDDINYCKANFRRLKNVFFSTNQTEIEDLCLLSLCDHFIISNSSFHWWGAILGEKQNSIIVHPKKFFDGKNIGISTADVFPERWIEFDYNKSNIKSKLQTTALYKLHIYLNRLAHILIKKVTRK